LSNSLALIIEDDFDLSTIFDEALKAAGFETQVIRDGTNAVKKLESLTPDVVILDLHLPGVGGADILNQIRADERMGHTRVIVTTADARLAETLHDKSDLVLVKPVSFTQLRDLARRLRKLVEKQDQ
jgi:DNA-binding response OmpR family regulator